MLRYFRLTDVMTLDRWHVAGITNARGEEPLLDVGVEYTGDVPLFAEVSTPGPALSFSLSSFAVPLATVQLADAVRGVARRDVQCVPVVTDAQHAVVALNSLRVVRCLDESRSEFVKWTSADNRPDLIGSYRQVTRLVLDREHIPGDAHFFRVEGWVVALIVSEEVRDAMERVGCEGARFTDVDD